MRKSLFGPRKNRIAYTPLRIGCQRRQADVRGVLSLIGQASLEMTISLICVFIILFGTLNVFLWMNKQMVQRQEYYEHSPSDVRVNGTAYGSDYQYGRLTAGDFNGDVPLVNEDMFYERLDIFGVEES